MLQRLKQKQPELIAKSASSLKTATVKTVGLMVPPAKSPDETLRELFEAVQAERVYSDGKTFVDMVPRGSIASISRDYRVARQQPDFNLSDFVEQHFRRLPRQVADYTPAPETTARQHVTNLWPILTRRNRKNRGSLVALPYNYVTPGGRFEEQFYWDSYFIMLGLAADGDWNMIYDMMRNYSFMLRKFRRIPTANRSYFLSRSQPPFFARMVELLATNYGERRTYAEFLPSMLTEYRFWMSGSKNVRFSDRRIVRMPGGELLNRYYDDKTTPRPESAREDVETAAEVDEKERLYLDLRAAAESGWDFSSRWFKDPNEIQTIETTSIIPVDLNCLLFDLENAIAKAYRLIRQPRLALRFEEAASRRADAIQRYFWNNETQFFEDYHKNTRHTTGRLTLAGVFPLYSGIATDGQAQAVAQRIELDFLRDGGVVTTLSENSQQWDFPNGWAPLQWVTIVALRRYGFDELAAEIRDRWCAMNESIFLSERKMVEKYNVVKATPGGGGEYALQDGFGWTNGVYAILKDEQEKQNG